MEQSIEQIEKRTNATIKRVHECKICNRIFNTKKQLLNHQSVHAQNDTNAADDSSNRLHCKTCGQKFRFHKSLLKHEEKHIVGIWCRTCGKSFNSLEEKDKHREEQHKALRCRICCTSFDDGATYLQHINNLHNGRDREMHMCSECGKQYKTKGELTHHNVSKCGTVKQYKCDMCGQSLMTAGSLHNHMLRHNSDPTHMCRFCAKLFLTSGQLTVHERIHTQDKAFVCDVCGKGFCHRQSLITHQTLHTGIKPYQCEGCGSAFSCVGNLLKHRKTHKETCGLIPLTTHRVKHPSTRMKVQANTPPNSKLKATEKKKKIQEILATAAVDSSSGGEQTKTAVVANCSQNDHRSFDGYNEASDNSQIDVMSNESGYGNSQPTVQTNNSDFGHLIDNSHKHISVNNVFNESHNYNHDQFHKNMNNIASNASNLPLKSVEFLDEMFNSTVEIEESIRKIVVIDGTMSNESTIAIDPLDCTNYGADKVEQSQNVSLALNAKDDTNSETENAEIDFDVNKNESDTFSSVWEESLPKVDSSDDSMDLLTRLSKDEPVEGKQNQNRPKPPKKKFPCKYCDRSYVQMCMLTKHEQKMHLNSYLDALKHVANSEHLVGDLSTECSGKTNGDDEINLKSLVNSNQDGLSLTSRPNQSTNSAKKKRYKNNSGGKKTSRPKSTLPYRCSCCKSRFNTKAECVQHKVESHAEELTCTPCNRIFANGDSLRTHENTYHKGIPRKVYSYVCKSCGLQFKLKATLISHEESNCGSGPEPLFPCPLCDKHFSSFHVRKTHMRVHQSEKKLLCKYCGKSFHWQGQLKIHERSHTGERPYKCTECHKAFSHRESLITHSSLHTGIKPHLCESCGSRFSCIGNLIKHRRTHASTCGLLTNAQDVDAVDNATITT